MISDKEFLILNQLRKNSRISYTKISSKTNIPISTIHDIVKRLKNKGILHKNVSLINFQKMGFNVRILLFLKSNNKLNLLDFLSHHQNVNSIKKISHNFDYLVDVIFKTFTDYISFKDCILEFDIIKIREHHLVENVKLEDAVLTQ